MEEKTIVIEDVTQAWRTLYLDIQKKSKLKIEAFNEVFSQTYTLLTERLPDSSLDKEIVALVAEAYLFANLKGEHYDSTCLASFILTERMLSYCAFSSAGISPEETVYAPARRFSSTVRKYTNSRFWKVLAIPARITSWAR